MNKISLDKEEIVGVYHDKKNGAYYFEVISAAEYEQFEKQESLSNLEAVFAISPKPFDEAETQAWELPDDSVLYVDRVQIEPSICNDTVLESSVLLETVIYDVLYDFLAINTYERGAKTLRAKIENDKGQVGYLVERLINDEDYMYTYIGEENNMSFFEVNAEDFAEGE